MSNSTLVQKRIEQHEREYPRDVEVSTKPVEECKIQEEDQTFSSSQCRAKGNPCSVRCKVLGIGSDTESDMFSLNLASPMETNNGCPITKRSILSQVITPWKIIFQSVFKKIEGRSYAVPHSPPLPEFRLSNESAFSRVGVDLAGPMYVRDIFAKGGGMNKVYIALFTCAISRAVHLELVPSLPAESFFKALARFKGRRGTPTLIVSDNGKTFKDSRVRAYCQSDGTKWRFNVEAAPWWGGFFERLVKSVKLSLKKCLCNARLNYDELSTILVEVEAVLNSRPLTYVYDEFEEPLTPSHLVIGRRLSSMPSKNCSIEVAHTQEAFSRRSRFLQRILDHFWNRWRAEYLTQLREQHRCSKRASSLRKVQVGDVVCIHEKTTPRQLWRLGRVQRLLPGPDGEVRSSVVKVKSGNLPSSDWRRPLQRLYPLEVKLNTEPDNAVPITVVRDEDVPAVVVNSS